MLRLSRQGELFLAAHDHFFKQPAAVGDFVVVMGFGFAYLAQCACFEARQLTHGTVAQHQVRVAKLLNQFRDAVVLGGCRLNGLHGVGIIGRVFLFAFIGRAHGLGPANDADALCVDGKPNTRENAGDQQHGWEMPHCLFSNQILRRSAVNCSSPSSLIRLRRARLSAKES